MKAIVLAAGKGKRLNSEKAHLPKVMREAAGRTLLSYVLENISFIPHEDTVIVVGYMADTVKAAFPGDYKFVMQTEQLGTGHATSMAKDELAGYTGDVLVCFGDMPLFKQETFKELFRKHAADGNAVTLLTAMTEVPPAYGRIIRDENGNMVDIVEQKDCTPEQAKIREVTPGVYVFKSEWLFKALAQLKNNNAQGEYYLTDTPKIIKSMGGKVGTSVINDADQILGVNTQEELESAERVLLKRQAEAK